MSGNPYEPPQTKEKIDNKNHRPWYSVNAEIIALLAVLITIVAFIALIGSSLPD
jgi:hypothetical protein